jgi:hypothetical protein
MDRGCNRRARLPGGLASLTAVIALLSVGCGWMPTDAKVRVIGHKKEPQGHYSVLFKVQEPAGLAGKYDRGATWRTDLVRDADGHLHEIGLNFTHVAVLRSASYNSRPRDYSSSPPTSKDTDFFECARRLD